MMRRFGLPVLPLILGVILGPIGETRFREALTISGGEVSGLFNEALAVTLYVIAALAILAPMVLQLVRRRTGGGGPALDLPTPTGTGPDESTRKVEK